MQVMRSSLFGDGAGTLAAWLAAAVVQIAKAKVAARGPVRDPAVRCNI